MGYFDSSFSLAIDLENNKKKIAFCANDITNPICNDVIKSIEEYYLSSKYDLIFLDSRNSIEIEKQNIALLYKMGIDGLIFIATDCNSHLEFKKYDSEIPTVYIYSAFEPGTLSFVCTDTYSATYKMTEYLIHLGHKRLAFIGNNERVKSRKRGFQQAGIDNNIEITSKDIFDGVLHYDTGLNIMEQIILNKLPYTAIIAGNDYVALGIMDCVNMYDLNIPYDFSVVGCDNIRLSRNSLINLTTIDQPHYDIGKKATEILCDKIFNHNKQQLYYVFEASFIIRGSCRAISDTSQKDTSEN